MIRLIACDIDGTLLPPGEKRLDPIYFDQIDRLAKQGIRFAAASGRQYTNLRRLFAPVADRIDYICENGSLIVCGGRIIYKKTVDRAFGEKLLRFLYEYEGCEPLLSGVETCYVQPKSADYARHMREYVGNDVTVVEDLTKVPEDFLKIAAYFRDGISPGAQQDIAEFCRPYMYPVVSGLAWIDLLLEDCNKGVAMQELQSALRISKAETAAFGDNENDIELLGQAGIACAMQQGSEKLKAGADHVVENVFDVLAQIIQNGRIG